MLKIAVPKGALFEGTLEILSRAGLDTEVFKSHKRKLHFCSKDQSVEYMIVRPTDIPVYVEYGAVDLGIVGKDVLMEGSPTAVEYLDLMFGGCKFVVAARAQDAVRIENNYEHMGSIRVATKYPNVTRRHFEEKGIQVELIKLYGAIEMAPVTGLSDIIVDISATGRTLNENGLVELETIADSTARLIGNITSDRLKFAEISALRTKLSAAVKATRTKLNA